MSKFSHSSIALAVCAALCTSCASNEGDGRADDRADLSARAAALRKVGDNTITPQGTDVFGPSNTKPGIAPAQLAIWKDPTFQEEFTKSYLAESEVEPSLTTVETEELQAIVALISDELLDEAIIRLDAARGPAGASAAFDYTLGNIYFQSDDLDPAASAYLMAVKKYPKFRRAWKNLALINVRQGNYASAIPAFTEVIELGGGDAVTYGLLGVSYTSTGDHIAAESAFRMATLLDPATVDWKKGLAGSLFKQERYADAASLVEALIDASPESADLWMMQASAYIGLGKPMKAAENYELVDRLGGSTADSLNNLGDIYLTQELFDLAVGAYARALERDASADPARAVRAAQVFSSRGALEATSDLIDEIGRLRGDSLDEESRKTLLKLEARIAVANGASDEEVRVLEEIVALDPLDGEALILLGQNSNRNGDPERAILYYERAAGIDGFEADAKVRHAQVLVGTGKYAEALPLLRRAQEIQPRDNIQEYLEQVERVSKQG